MDDNTVATLAASNISVSKLLGSGAFSEVFKGKLKHNGENHQVAVKLYTTKFTHISPQQLFELARTEVEMASKFDHPNVMRAFSLVATRGVIAGCFELSTGGDLASRIIKDKGMTAKESARSLAGIASGLQYLHESMLLVHCDVKAENVLMDVDGNAKLADFDATVPIGTPMVQPRGTLDLLPPELVEPNSIFFMQPSNDLWSLGIVAYLTLFGTYPWDKADPLDDRFAAYAEFRACQEDGEIIWDNTHAWACIPESLNNLFGQLLALDEGSRGTAGQAASFFRDNWEPAVKHMRENMTKRRRRSGGRSESPGRWRKSTSNRSRSSVPSRRGRFRSMFRTKSPRPATGSPLLSQSPSFDASNKLLSPPRQPRVGTLSPMHTDGDTASESEDVILSIHPST